VITGFNTDIEHDGVVYHVQTEDKGLASPLILSLVYSGGAILASKRSPYQDLIASGFDEAVLSERLKHQHRLICAAITAGRIEELKRMGSRVVSEQKAARSETRAAALYEPMIVETSAERSPADAEPKNEMIVETSSERPQVYESEPKIRVETAAERSPVAAEPENESRVESSSNRSPLIAQPPITYPIPAEDVLPRSRPRAKAPESAYTVYDSRRKAAARATAEPESGLVLTIIDEGEFYAGQPFTVRVLLQNRSDKKEIPVSGVTVSLKILGTGFRPQIFSFKTARDGVGVVSGQIPHFSSGRAAIVIRAVLDEQSAEVRRVIHPAA
jgi:hypothetical protein